METKYMCDVEAVQINQTSTTGNYLKTRPLSHSNHKYLAKIIFGTVSHFLYDIHFKSFEQYNTYIFESN